MTEFEIALVGALNAVAKAIGKHADAVLQAGQDVSDVGPAIEKLAAETGGINAALSEGLGDIEIGLARVAEYAEKI